MPIEPSRRRAALIAVLAAALLARALVVLAILPDPERVTLASDTRQYLSLGTMLAETGRFATPSRQGPVPDALRTPGYPALIAVLIGLGDPRPLVSLAVVQALLGTLAAGGVILLGERLVSPRAGLLAGLIYALSPIAAVMTGYGYSETLFAALMIGAALALTAALERDRPPLSAGSGVIYGLAALVRPIGLPLLPLLAAIPLTRLPLRRGWLHALALAAGFLLAAGPWMARNAAIYGRFALTTISGYNLFYYNAASLEAHRLGIPVEEARRRLNTELEARPAPDSAWPGAAEGALARETILAHPLAFAWHNGVDALNGLRPGFSFMLGLFGRGSELGDPVSRFMTGDIGEIAAAMRGQAGAILLLEGYMALHTAGLIAFSLIGVIGLAARRDWAALILLGLIPALLLYLPGLASNARFRAPVEPFLAVAAAAGLLAVQRAIRRRPPA